MQIKKSLLIVDDESGMLGGIKEFFEQEYTVIEAATPEAAIAVLEHQQTGDIAAIIKTRHDDTSGKPNVLFDYMRFNKLIESIPTVVISATHLPEAEEKSLMKGAADYVTLPVKPTVLQHRVRRIVSMSGYTRDLQEIVEDQTSRLENFSDYMIDVLTGIMQYKHTQTRASLTRIHDYTKVVLECIHQYCMDQYRLTDHKIAMIAAAAIVRDIGEIAIPDTILLNRHRLTQEEEQVLQAHTVRGSEIMLSVINNDNNLFVKQAVDICRWHHERWDGSGFPDGLVGDAIPISAQAASIADIYDGMRTGRFMGDVYSHTEALGMIDGGYAGSFSPVLMESLKMVEADFDEIFEKSAV